MTIKKVMMNKEMRRHAMLTTQAFELFEGKTLAKAIDISYEAIVEKDGQIDQERLKKKNDQLEWYIITEADTASKLA